MTMIRTGLVFAAALFAAVFQTSAAPDVEIADVSVMAGGVEFVVRGKGAMFVRESDGKLVRLLDFNLGVGDDTGRAVAFPDGRENTVEVVEDTAERCVVRTKRSLSRRSLKAGSAAAPWDAVRLDVDYIFRKDTPGVAVVERLTALKPFVFFSWIVPMALPFERYSLDGGPWHPFRDFHKIEGRYATKAGAYLIGETAGGARWWMGREFAIYDRHVGFYAVSDTHSTNHGRNIEPGISPAICVCIGRLRDDSDIERMRKFRNGDGRLPVERFSGSWERMPAAAWRGETKDYRPHAGLNWNGAKDLSFTAKLAQDDTGVLVRVEVKDDIVVNPFSGSDAGLGDSVHVVFADTSGGKRLSRVVSALDGVREAGGYTVGLKIGWNELSASGINRAEGVRFNVCVADQDGAGDGYENWMGIADGIIGGRDASKFPFLDLSGVRAAFVPERPVLPDHADLRRKIDAVAAANARLPSSGKDEYTSCMKAMTEYFLEFMRADLDAKDKVFFGQSARKIDGSYRYYMDDRINKNADSLLELQSDLAARQQALALGRIKPVVTTRHPKDVRPVIADGGFKVDGRELLLIGPNTWTNMKGWDNGDIAKIAAAGFNQFNMFYVGGTNYADMARQCEAAGLYCVWGSLIETERDIVATCPQLTEAEQNSYNGGKGYFLGSLVPSNPPPNFVFQVSHPEGWARKRENTGEWAEAFRGRLKKIFGSLEALNSSLAADYPSWTNIDFKAALKNDALKYESFRYRMAENIKRNIPTQRWLAARFGLPRSTHYSTHYNVASLDPLVTLADFEAIWRMFDIVGFDGGFGLEGSEWAIDFPKGGFELDFARSVFPGKPVANNENHVIIDGTYREHTREEIYLSNMLAFLLGQNSSSVWVWANTRHTKGEYMFTRAHMCREVVRCALELRCHAEEIGAFRHAPSPPFRILHSLPSFAERDAYVRSLYGLYGAVSFTGWANRFLTERDLGKGDFKGAKVVVVPDARRVSDGTFAALAAFADKGGTVLVDGREALTKDQWGKIVPSRKTALGKFRLFADASSKSRFAALADALTEKGVVPPLDLRTSSGGRPFGIMWRTARTSAGEDVAFIANLSRETVELSVPGCWNDVLGGGASVPSALKMKPLDLIVMKAARPAGVQSIGK
jgi:hypothetical protein